MGKIYLNTRLALKIKSMMVRNSEELSGCDFFYKFVLTIVIALMIIL